LVIKVGEMVFMSPASVAGCAIHSPQNTSTCKNPAAKLPLLLPLVLLVVLLLLQVDDRYRPQLAAVLTFPQSVGIVGGRPGASLYFLGAQGSSVLYLDPHEVQEVRSRQHLQGFSQDW
jgi:hypothetical protein